MPGSVSDSRSKRLIAFVSVATFSGVMGGGVFGMALADLPVASSSTVTAPASTIITA